MVLDKLSILNMCSSNQVSEVRVHHTVFVEVRAGESSACTASNVTQR